MNLADDIVAKETNMSSLLNTSASMKLKPHLKRVSTTITTAHIASPTE